jgi:hypothetical protein
MRQLLLEHGGAAAGGLASQQDWFRKIAGPSAALSRI